MKFVSANRVTRPNFNALIKSALVNLSLDLIAQANPSEGARNPKTIRFRKRTLKIAKGKIVAELEAKRAKKVKTPKVKAPAKPRAKKAAAAK